MPTEIHTTTGAVILRAFHKGVELPYSIERFQYVYSEEGDDLATLTFTGIKKEQVDNPEFQERAEIKVIWGFIGGNSKERLVYVDNPKWTMNKDGIKVVLECTDKATTAKQTKSKAIYQDKDYLDVATNIANKHGLKMVYMDSKEGQIALTQGLEYNKKFLRDKGITFKTRPNIPQANKSDAQFLYEQGRKEPEQIYAETRDDTLIIKKRDFNQTPYRAYTYQGGTGELLSFEPETKNKGKLGAALNTMLSTWDGLGKQYVQQMANMLRDSRKLYLVQYLKNIGFIPNKTLYKGNRDKAIEKVVEDLLDRGLYNTSEIQKFQLETFGEATNYQTIAAGQVAGRIINTDNNMGSIYGQGSAADNTSRKIVNAIPVSGEELLANLEKAEQAVTNQTHDPTGEALDDINGAATNDLNRNNLQRNPATALIWGDTGIEVGQILTFLEVGKKYGGNYYTTKSTHTIEEGSGYTVFCEMAREGHNVKVGSNDKSIKKADSKINDQVGLDQRSERNIMLKQVKNKP